MEFWHYWVIAGLLFVIIEILTFGFAFLCLFFGALAGALVAWLGYDFGIQILWFSIVSLIAFVTVRPILTKYFHNNNKDVLSNISALIGRKAIVTEEINTNKNSGRVKIDGDDWKAITKDNQIIPIGDRVIVEEINSIILTIKKTN